MSKAHEYLYMRNGAPVLRTWNAPAAGQTDQLSTGQPRKRLITLSTHSMQARPLNNEYESAPEKMEANGHRTLHDPGEGSVEDGAHLDQEPRCAPIRSAATDCAKSSGSDPVRSDEVSVMSRTHGHDGHAQPSRELPGNLYTDSSVNGWRCGLRHQRRTGT